MEILKVKNFSFAHSGRSSYALKNISFGLEKGEIVLLYGKSGCGKTTLLRLVNGLCAPKGRAEGEFVRTFGGGGYVFQDPEAQIVTDKVWHELAFGCENMGWSREKIRRRVGETAEYFGLTNFFRSDTATLSGGQKQLLNLAAAVVTEPEVLLLDEPTSQLDPIAAEEFMETVLKLNRDFGMTIIMSEHNTEKAFALADRVIYMENGGIRHICPPRELGELLLGEPMFEGLPCALRIGAALKAAPPLPLTAGEGKALVRRYKNSRQVERAESHVFGSKVMELKNVFFRYEKNGPEILRGVSLEIHRGEIISILGGNGSGKSTLLCVMCALLNSRGGRVKRFGSVSLLPQDPKLCFTHDTLAEDWKSMAEITGFGETAALAERLGLTQLMESHPYDLSGGEQQRAALGKVLMRRPDILLLDEPAKGLDAVNKAVFVGLIKELARKGMAVVAVTHDTELAAKLSHGCALLFDGELIGPSSPEEFFGGNIYYTTPAARISRGHFENAVSAERVSELCLLNGERDDA